MGRDRGRYFGRLRMGAKAAGAYPANRCMTFGTQFHEAGGILVHD